MNKNPMSTVAPPAGRTARRRVSGSTLRMSLKQLALHTDNSSRSSSSVASPAGTHGLTLEVV